MDFREKLVELLSEKCMETCKQRKGYVCSVEEYTRCKERCCGFYADHLIANGVTVQENTAANVTPVRHGRWVHTDLASHWLGKDECSECTYHKKDRSDLSHNNYCPYCGAKMDGELNE